MKSKLTISIIGSMLLTLITPTSVKAQAQGDIGTSRQPQTCSSRSEPRTGVISAAQAIKYATCEAEADRRIKSPGTTDFIDISSLEVNPKPRPANDLDIHYFGNAIAKSAVYDIRGTAIAYSCGAINNLGRGNRGKNCLNTNVDDRGQNNSLGVCFRETSGFTKTPGNWRCRLGVGKARLEYGPPPDSANTIGSSEIQSSPNDNGQTYFDRAWSKMESKDFQGSLTDFNRAIQINPNNGEFYHKRAILKLYHLNDHSGGMKDLKQSAKLYRQQGNTTQYESMLKAIRFFQ
jgi:tetratricopeptide (TPR) repeat protein